MVKTKADFDRALGGRIRAARDRVGVKQEHLAQAVGLSRTSITNIERGRQGVQAYLLVRIAEILGRSAVELLPTTLGSGSPMPDKVKELEPSKRAWAERVMRSAPKDDEYAT